MTDLLMGAVVIAHEPSLVESICRPIDRIDDALSPHGEVSMAQFKRALYTDSPTASYARTRRALPSIASPDDRIVERLVCKRRENRDDRRATAELRRAVVVARM